MNFVAIDFETANRQRASACEIGLVIVENSKIVDSYRTLIKPSPNHFEPGNIRVHNIRPIDVMNSPSFDKIFDELKPYLEDKHIIAHNATFDIGVLRACLDQYQLQHPNLEYSCSVKIARRAFPEAPRYGLSFISHFLDIQLNHHQALSDAKASAEVVLKAAQRLDCHSMNDLLKQLKLQSVAFDHYKTPKPKRKRARTSTTTNRFGGPGVFSGMRVVFTGELMYCSRQEAQEMVIAAGGKCTQTITNATNFLVQGIPSIKRKSKKIIVANQKIKEGANLRILTEEDFFRFLKNK